MREWLVVLAVVCGSASCKAMAQGTKLWSVDRYDTMQKGSTDGVSIRSDGRLEAGPATSLLFDSGKSYVWAAATDALGHVFVGMGGTSAGSAVVMRIGGAGTTKVQDAVKVFEGKDNAVQALKVAPDGSLLVATSPDGKVFRVAATVAAGDGTAGPVVVFDPALTEEKPKYIWDVAVGKGGDVYVATGAPAVVYRVAAGGGKAGVLFRTADQHIRCLLMGADGTLWVGSDGAGVIYRIATGAAGAKPFAVYAAPKREITALAMDAAGGVYAAGVGAKSGPGPGLPPLPVTGNLGVNITFVQPQSANAATANALVPEGSEIYRIAGAGGVAAPQKLLTLKDDVVYALVVRNGALLAATGNRGRVYRVDTEMPGRFADVAHLEAAQGMVFAALKDGLVVATSNGGRVFRLGDAVAKDATYTSEVFDAQAYSQWGRAEVRGAGAEVFVRSGNVESPLMGWSEWAALAKDGAVTLPAGRYVQWKAVLRGGGGVDSVGLNYLAKNMAPVVDEVVVQAGARVTAGFAPGVSTTVQVSFPTPPGVMNFSSDPNSSPLTAQKDKNAVTVRWLAHDDNGDDMMFAVWFRGVGEANWRLLKDKISERFLSFDSALLPDGSYAMKVVASDAPVHTDSDALMGEKVSGVFVVDTTPPVPGALTAVMEAGSPAKIHARLEARDATSPIAHAEYSVDAGPWQYVEPLGKVSDSLVEKYDFVAAIPNVTAGVTDAKEHVIAVRVYDRYENVAAVKALVR